MIGTHRSTEVKGLQEEEKMYFNVNFLHGFGTVRLHNLGGLCTLVAKIYS